MKLRYVIEYGFCGLLSAAALNLAVAQTSMAGFSPSRDRAAVSTSTSDPTWRVSTTPAPAHVLIEEFTGLHCSYCPQAHAIVNNLTYAAPGKVHVMAVHTGNLAAPNANEEDLRTTIGNTFYAWQGEGGMPSGNINRTPYTNTGVGSGASYMLSRNRWAAVAKRLLSAEDTAPINLFVEAKLDTFAHNIHINVEIYAVRQLDEPLFLHVAVLEDFIPGTQAGSSIRPYLHRHVLRDMLTGLTGDTLKKAELYQGAYLRRTYTYKLPKQYNNRTPNAANLSCLAFVSDETRKVLNSTENKIQSPTKVGLDYLQITLNKLEQNRICGGKVYDVYVVNPSDDTVRSLAFAFTLNGDTRTYQLDHLCLLPKSESELCLNTDFKLDKLQNANVYTLKVTAANGQSVSSNTLNNSFRRPIQLPTAAFKIRFTSDLFGGENTVCLSDEAGTTLYRAGPFQDGQSQSYTSNLIQVKPNEVYALRITDAFRDGVQTAAASGTSASGTSEPGAGTSGTSTSGTAALELLTETDSVFYRADVGNYGLLTAFCYQAAPSDTLPNEPRHPVQNLSDEWQVQLSPNPTKTQTILKIEGLNPTEDLFIRLYNLAGRLEKTGHIEKNHLSATFSFPISGADLKQGIYLVQVRQRDRQKVVKLVMLEK